MKIKVKPAPGLIIVDPKKMRDLPVEGAEVVMSSYWERRLRTGDVLLVETNETEIKPKTKKGGK